MQIQSLIRQLQALYDGKPWIEDTFLKKWERVSEPMAFIQPMPYLHSIAENVSHLITWRQVILLRLQGDRSVQQFKEERLSLSDLRKVGWDELKRQFEYTHKELIALLEQKEDGFLSENYGKHTNAYYIEGWIHHDTYHLGQIGLLIKMIEEMHKPKAKIATSDIKLLLLDVDGVMTDGGMYYTESGDFIKKFNAKDGLAIRRAERYGLEIGFISSSTNSNIIRSRAATLKVDLVHVGDGQKIEIVKGWLAERNLDFSQVAYIGDDLNDLEVMQKVGLACCPADACKTVKEQVHVILQSKGGEGVVREFIEEVLGVNLELWGIKSQEKQ